MVNIGSTLLICDDEILILEKLQLLLEDFAERVLVSSNGEECLAVLRTEKVDCVVCDINMPKVDGVQVIREFSKEGEMIPFIFYSAHATADIVAEVMKYGAFDFVHKPGIDELESAVKRGLSMNTSPKTKSES